jgi:glyoxylase-like metal-dependent hydrolase (beta-lactamase superfamily II)
MRPAARAEQDRMPALDRLTAEPPDAILVTHAHIDHTGALPLASEMFPAAPIYCTETTLLLTRLLLADSVRVMEAEHLAQEGETPLYTAEVVARTLARGGGVTVAYRDGHHGVLSGRGRWGQVEVALDDGTRVWWQDKDVRIVDAASTPERAAGDRSDRAADATGAAVADDARAE